MEEAQPLIRALEGGMKGGRERDEDKECRAKECAFRLALMLNPSLLSSDLIAKTDLKAIYSPLSIMNI